MCYRRFLSKTSGLVVTAFAARRLDVSHRLQLQKALNCWPGSDFRKNVGMRIETLLHIALKVLSVHATVSTDEKREQFSMEKCLEKKIKD